MTVPSDINRQQAPDAAWYSPIRQVAGRCLFVYPAAVHTGVVDLMAGLTLRGWQVDATVLPAPSSSGSIAHRFARWQTSASPLARFAGRLGQSVARELVGVPAVSAWFDQLHAMLARNQHDVVVAFIDGSPTGLARLVTRAHPRAVLVNLSALTTECRRRASLPLLRAAACLGARQRLHPDLLRPIDLDATPAVVYGSWRAMDAARVAGVPSGAFRIVGLPLDEPGASAPLREYPKLARPVRAQVEPPARVMRNDGRREQELTAAVRSVDELLRDQCGLNSGEQVVRLYRQAHL